MEQLSLLGLLVLILVNLGFVSSMVQPFSHHLDKEDVTEYSSSNSGSDSSISNNNKNNSKINTYHQLTRIILSASTARFILSAVGIVFINNSPDPIPFRVTSTNTRSSYLDLIYCIFCITSNVIGLGYKQNVLLLETSSFMELNTTSLIVCRLIKLADRHRCCKSYLKMSVLCCATFIFSRILLPVLFLCHALALESPFVMGSFPLIWFFISIVFFSVFHSICMYYSVRRIIKASVYLSEEGTHTCSVHEPFSVCSYMERLTNDIYDDCDNSFDVDVVKTESCDTDDVSFKCNPTKKLRDLNYGLLAPCDNRNLCSFVSGVEEEKTNFLHTKNISKNELMYKLLLKRNIPYESECYSVGCSQDISEERGELCKKNDINIMSIRADRTDTLSM